MICKYRFGKPLETDSVINHMNHESGEMKNFFVSNQENQTIMKRRMKDNDRIYGLGENVRGINKRGWIYSSCCTDETKHSEDKSSLYGAHNFLIVDGDERFGLFIDFPGIVTYDLGYTKSDELVITIEGIDVDFYLITSERLNDIVHEFREMIGQSYIPPKWAFGYGQSRWSYMNEDEIREVVRNHRENGIPLDSIYLDIDYMDHYKDFTVNQESFPELTKFVQEMKNEGIHLVPIIDAGIKAENGYDIYEEGKANHYLCEKEDGSEFKAAVWPGLSVFPDVFNPEARKWFGMKYKRLTDTGIEGFWNDMNEPSIFYTEDRMKEVFQELIEYKDKDIAEQEFWRPSNLVMSLSNNPVDYVFIYHNFNGHRIRHDKVHNLYGYFMTRAAKEALDQIKPGRRMLLFSRSSCIGMHRYSGMWTGDNQSIWSHLLLNIKMMPSLNMCGFLFSGADLGGFGANTTEDLMLRWLQFGVFTPLMRNHSSKHARRQEVYRFGAMDSFRTILRFRYRLLPYLYSEFVKAALSNSLLFQPLAFAYENDEMAAQIEDQLLLGESIMIAPVYQQNANGRYVYLPESMKLIRVLKNETISEEIMEAGIHYVLTSLDEITFFIRPNHLLPLAHPTDWVALLDEDHFEVYGYKLNEQISYDLYQDDGYTTKPESEGKIRTFTL